MAVAADAAITHVKLVATDEIMIFEWLALNVVIMSSCDTDDRATQTVHRA